MNGDSTRFEHSLNEVDVRGGYVRLISWPNKELDKVPESGADWGDIATMIRSHVVATNSGITLSISPDGLDSEEFNAIWIKAELAERENSGSPSEDPMDTLIFRDESKFHFDHWSEGEPFVLVDSQSSDRESNADRQTAPTTTNKRRDFHSFLNSRQGLFTLIGVVIAALALVYQIFGRYILEPIGPGGPQTSVPSVLIGSWTGNARGPFLKYQIKLTMDLHSNTLQMSTSIATCQYRLALVESTKSSARFDATIAKSVPAMACSTSDEVQLSYSEKSNSLDYSSKDNFGGLTVSGELKPIP